jgi:hypothetical protein
LSSSAFNPEPWSITAIGVRSVMVMRTVCGQLRPTSTYLTSEIGWTRATIAFMSTRANGVPMGTSAAFSTLASEIVPLPLTSTSRAAT